jgi:phage shock protein PspC (stress-responsive transcriptional regulator)
MARFTLKMPKKKINDGMSELADAYQFRDQFTNAMFGLSFVMILVCAYIVYANISLLPPEVPLFFYYVRDVDKLVDQGYLWLFPVTLLLFFLANYAFSLMLFRTDVVLARVFGVFTCVWTLIAVYILWNIVSLLIQPNLLLF